MNDSEKRTFAVFAVLVVVAMVGLALLPPPVQPKPAATPDCPHGQTVRANPLRGDVVVL